MNYEKKWEELKKAIVKMRKDCQTEKKRTTNTILADILDGEELGYKKILVNMGNIERDVAL